MSYFNTVKNSEHAIQYPKYYSQTSRLSYGIEKAPGQHGWLYKQPRGTKSSVEQIIVLCPVSYHSFEYFPKFLQYCQENDDSFIIDSFPLEK